MQTLSRAVQRLAWLSVFIGGVGLFLSMFAGIADVVTSKFGHPIHGAYELSESVMVLVVFGGLAYAQIQRKHIRVELIYLQAGPRMQSLMDVLADLAGIAFFGLLLWQGWNEALYSLSIDEATSGAVRFPLYPARFALAFGAALYLLQLLLDLCADLALLARGTGGRLKDDAAHLER
ncbi:TRAP transporter small permease [Orrella sp. JC864]|uniref:TRAP transporter small permease subunit n=1 Tax=Orrella sp. JC864 TaxID=3120298 RepID=UPI00300AF0A5